jgi:Pyruvate/2-oxoacid:ferredoxin oxidoreductase delta subunit
MGHIINHEREYRLLQQRLDHTITGAPYAPSFMAVLKILFTPEEAHIARQIPLRPTLLTSVANKLNLPPSELSAKIESMAERGLVFDFVHNGQTFIVLAPVVIGFFEFIFMRTRDNLPLKELAELFEEYMANDDRFARSIFEGSTQLGRALVHEEALPADNYSEVLDWEKASAIVASATSIGLSLCTCRHKASHLGRSCHAPLETCLTMGRSADVLIKKGMAVSISNGKALRIIEDCKRMGLMQIADNVQRDVGFICNCCGCCCEFIQAIKRFDLRNAVITSNWLAAANTATCKKCGACITACPVGALQPNLRASEKEILCDETLCLGCGVCQTVCKFNSLTMIPRQQRALVPETTYDKIISMAIERGKLSNLMLDDPAKLNHRALGRLIGIIEKSSPVKALLAVKPIKSAFLTAIVSRIRKATENQ